MSAVNAAELVLWAALAVLFWSKGLQRRFPAMGYYLALRAIATPLQLLVIYLESQPLGKDIHAGQIYYFGFEPAKSARAGTASTLQPPRNLPHRLMTLLMKLNARVEIPCGESSSRASER